MPEPMRIFRIGDKVIVGEQVPTFGGMFGTVFHTRADSVASPWDYSIKMENNISIGVMSSEISMLYKDRICQERSPVQKQKHDPLYPPMEEDPFS